MRWRGKLLMALIIYFAGFASAIYVLAPVTDRPGGSGSALFAGSFDSEAFEDRTRQFAAAAGVGMQKFLSFAEDKAVLAGQAIKDRLAEEAHDNEK